ncbi:hypothetical protein GCM10010266_61490 [Streptomyces griseomycini]|nr:hypothetical protein GCM10010266_61490 [Streptomyces griseomycini]GGR49433.1 hypothetical protein GCM10015536_63880 [Streptomyces griseomycini]
MLGIRGAAATRRASTGCSMTVDNALLPRDDWTGFRADRVGYGKRRRNQPIRAHGDRVTSVTAFMHPSDAALHARPARHLRRSPHLPSTGCGRLDGTGTVD